MVGKKMEEMSVVQMLESGQNDLLWFNSRLNWLISKYNNQFIAFRDGNVIDSDQNLDKLIKKLQNKQIDISNTFIKFVSKVKFIL